MEIIKTVYANKKNIKTLKYEGNDAYIEFINLLSDKIKKRYDTRIKKNISFSTNDRIIKATQKDGIYTYKYTIKNIDKFINII